MRFRHHERPERSSIRQSNDAAMGTVEAAVFRDGLPGEDSTFTSGVTVGDPFEPPAQVENVLASAGLRTILIEWDRLEDFQTVDGAGGYEVQLDTVNTFDVAPRVQRTSATMASFTDLTPDTAYFVRVRGVQGADNAGDWSVTASATTALADTGDIQASAITADKIAANAVNAAKLAAITMQVGKYIQSDNYDGTDVATADATQGFRIEAEGDSEFQNVRVRGDVDATTLSARSGEVNLITNSSFEDELTPLAGWSSSVGTLAAVPHAETEWGTSVARVTGPASVADIDLTHDVIGGIVPGVSYQLSANMAIGSAFVPMVVNVDLVFDWYDESLTLISTTTLPAALPGNAENDFRDVVGKGSVAVAPATARSVGVSFVVQNAPANFIAYFDNVKLRAVSALVGGALSDMTYVRAEDTTDPTANGVSLARDGLWFRIADRYTTYFQNATADGFHGRIVGGVGDGGAGDRRHYLRMQPATPTGVGSDTQVYLFGGNQDGSNPAEIWQYTDEIKIGKALRRMYPPYYVYLTGSATLASGVATSLPMGTTISDADGLHTPSDPYIQIPINCIAHIDVEMTMGAAMSVDRVMVGWKLGSSATEHWSTARDQNGNATTIYAARSGVIKVNGGDSIHFRGFFDGLAANEDVTHQARVTLFPAE